MSITSISYYTFVRYTESEASAVKTQVRGNALCKTVRLPYLASTWTKCINSLGLVWLEQDIIRTDDKDTKQVAWKDRHWKEQDGIHVITVQYHANQVLFLDEGLLIPLMKTFKVRFELFFKSVDYERWMEGVPSSHYLRGRKRKNGERVKNNEQASFASVKRRLHQLQQRNMTGSLFSGDVDSEHVFVPGKPPVDYQRAREAKPIAKFALKQMDITHNQAIAAAWSEHCPPMLEKGSYVSWSSRFIRYIDGKKEYGKMLKDSIENGPHKIKEITDQRNPDGNPPVPPFKRIQE
ncbi:hypothetical protein Tco_0254950 [Tanacetum coccineum]